MVYGLANMKVCKADAIRRILMPMEVVSFQMDLKQAPLQTPRLNLSMV